MTSAAIRQSFLDFFASKQHAIVPSSSLMPDSPNLLFTNAGMNQFVPIFLGEQPCPYKPGRAADTQKCIRAGGKHNDLEDVGLDTYHHTFFEMLGNWSFGDYFKKEAIEWAWELVVGTWKFPANRVYATVYKPGPGDPAAFDQEAYDYWKAIFEKAGLDPAVHIVYGNKKDNFWMMGDTGPCGPCSELHIDLTPEGDTKGALVNTGDARCIEIWNLVFIQFNATPDGKFEPLPARHVDTGMGFERVSSIIQGTKNFSDFKNAKISNYETDVFRPIFDAIEKLCGKRYNSTLPAPGATPTQVEKDDIAFRVIADHIRTLTCSVADGILPSNEGRGYVLRRILRRAVRYGRELGVRDAFFYQLVEVVGQTLGDVFPEIRKRQADVEKILRAEELSFSKTLDNGIDLFEKVVEGLAARNVTKFPGDDAFKLYDTYGFPLDLTQLMARERGLIVDETSFEKLMEVQRARSKASQKKEIIALAETGEGKMQSQFVGFDQKTGVAIEVLTHEIDLPKEEQDGFIRARLFFSPTPFYGEMGGQVGDTGWIESGNRRIEIVDTQKAGPGVFVHLTEDLGELESLEFPIKASVDLSRRALIEGHHSVTHLMHWALRKVLGTTVRQKGSYVGPDRLRFDFTHIEAVKPEQLREIEQLVNDHITSALPVKWEERAYSDVKGDESVLQFFGDKYGETVRVVDIGGFSKELCGGTHVTNTADIGVFRILSEGAIAAGIRRIEAVSGEALRAWLGAELDKQEMKHRELIEKSHGITPLPVADLNGDLNKVWHDKQARADVLVKMENDLREHEKELAKKKQAGLQTLAAELAPGFKERVVEVDGANILVANMGEAENDLLQLIAAELKKNWSGAVFLGSASGGRVILLASVSPELTKRIQAGKWIQFTAPLVGGKGGGKPELAQGGGSDPSKLDEALAAALDFAKAQFGG
jgi:alanyl-tRNA synthetase